MPTVRKLRNKRQATTAATDLHDDDDDEFGAAEEDPFVSDDTPDLVESFARRVKNESSSRRVKRESLASPPRLFECDTELPRTGLDLDAKLLLLDLIDSVNGFDAITRRSRLLSKWCSDNPELLGIPRSERRKRTTFLMDRWKREPGFDVYKIRNALQLKQQQQANSASHPSFQQKQPPPPPPLPPPPQVPQQQIKSPPRLKKTTTASQPKMTTFGSPLRVVGSKKSAVKGKDLVACFLLLHLACWLY